MRVWKKIIWAVVLAGPFLCGVRAQHLGDSCDDIVGLYSAYDRKNYENFYLDFYRNGEGEYEAVIVGMDQPMDDLGKPRTDVNNPHSTRRHIPLSGLVVVRGLEYDARRKEWKGGRVYDPTSGKTYRCFIEFQNDSVIKMKGYVGMRMLGKKLFWTKL